MKKHIIAAIAVTAAFIFTGNLSAQQRTRYVTPRNSAPQSARTYTRPTVAQPAPQRFVVPNSKVNYNNYSAPAAKAPSHNYGSAPNAPYPPSSANQGSHVKPAPAPQTPNVRPGAGYQTGPAPNSSRFFYVR